MLLIGVFALLMLIALPASADPISIALITAVAGSAAATGAAVAVTTFVLTSIASTALAFVSAALFRPPQRSGSQASSGSSAPTTDNKITIRQAAASRQIIYGKSRASGVYGFVHATDNNQYLHLVIIFAGHRIEEFSEIWFNDEAVTLSEFGLVTSGKWAGKAGVNKHLGAADQVADASLIANTGGVWTAQDRLQGCAYLYVRLEWDAKVYAAGVPNITAVIKGKNDIRDPRDDSVGWSDNPALCLANYLADETYGVPIDFDTGLDQTALIAAANACDEEVDLAAGGTEKRYTCGGVLQSSAEPQENIGLLLASMHGQAPYDGETWRIQAGVYQTPTITLTDDDLRSGPRIQTLTSRRDLHNAVKGTYVGPSNAWQEADFPPIESEAFAELDGQTLYKDMALPLTRTASMAQRIAKIDLLRVRQQVAASMPCKLSAWRVQAGDTVMWTSERYGWTAKVFEVRRARFAVGESPTGPTLGVDLDLIEVAASDYDWETSEEQTVDPAPNSNFPSVFGAMPPSNLRVSESLYATRDGGGVKAKVTLAWDASPDAFVTSGGGYLVEYRLSGESLWVPLPQTDALTLDILDVDPGTYDFRVFAVNWAGNRSDVALQTLDLPIAGLGAAPVEPQNLTLSRNGNFAVLRWDFPQDLDVQIGGTIVFKHAAQVTGASWEHGVTISEPLGAAMSVAQLPLVAGTYMAKFLDAGGNWSEGFAAFATGQDGALEFSGLVGGSLVEDPGFAGTKTGCAVAGGILKLGGAGLFSAIPLVSAVPSIFYYGGVTSSGTYGWSEKIDLGSKKRHRLTISKTTLVENVFDLLSQRTGNVSTWPMFGGSVAGLEADAVTYGRFTDDDPDGGSPTWSEWARVDCGEYDCRGHELETELVSRDPSFDINISALSAIAEEVV